MKLNITFIITLKEKRINERKQRKKSDSGDGDVGCDGEVGSTSKRPK